MDAVTRDSSIYDNSFSYIHNVAIISLFMSLEDER